VALWDVEYELEYRGHGVTVEWLDRSLENKDTRPLEMKMA
jgi:hypothetical protein